MGYIRHHAIAVTTFSEEYINSAHKKASEIFTISKVSEILPSGINGYYSFFIAPDGSKELWPTSIQADEQRAAFIDWIKYESDDCVRYCEFFYGDDEDKSEIVNHN